MRSTLVISVAIVNVAASWSLQFVNPPSDSARSPNNAIITQSKAYNVTAQTRRNIFVQEENNTVPKYAIDCGSDKACLEAHGLDEPDGTFRPYTQEELERLLTQYAASQGRPTHENDASPANKLANLYMDEEDTVINVLESNQKTKEEQSKSASWNKHNNPYEDQKGWVTLEPIPWAQSQIQKWEPNVKPEIPSWDHRPSSAWGSRPSLDYSTNRPWNKPTYEYKPSRPQWNRPAHWNQDIITDNQPGYFPSPQSGQRPWYDQEPYGSNHPPQHIYEKHPLHQGHPAEGEGQWVLLSSTKGYSIPQRTRGGSQRALNFIAKTPAASISSHRTVRLTVLPADNSTNTTLSHGGLLEVEQTLQTVEEAQREHAAKMLKLNTLKPEDHRASGRRSSDEVKLFSATPSKTAVLAAIGAGMVPATMAMLLPMVLGRRRRSARSSEELLNKTQPLFRLHSWRRSY